MSDPTQGNWRGVASGALILVSIALASFAFWYLWFHLEIRVRWRPFFPPGK